MARLVTVVLVTWNSGVWLRRCLEGIRAQDWPAIELVVVDNASTDDSAAQVSGADLVIRNEENRGFSAAVNQALSVAKGEFIQLVNPDCFLTSGYVTRMVAAFDACGPRFGFGTGQLLRAEGTSIQPAEGIDSLGMRMTRSGRHLDITDFALLDGGKTDGEPVEVFGVSGAAATYRKSFLDAVAIGGEVFDEDFFAYREDADLSWRGRLFGWRGFVAPAAVAYHVRRVTPEARRALPAGINMHGVKNRFLLRLKNQGLYLALRNAPGELFRDLVVVAAALTVERTSLPAFTWLWRNRTRILARRSEIQRRRIVGDRELARWFR